jgi:branched-chain amino acid transport system substrate-binding protein
MKSILRISLAAPAVFLFLTVPRSASPAEPLYFGVSGPLTGPDAQYGAQWKKGFDLALASINGHGGVRGRSLEYIFNDSQSDPRQAVAVAQKFVTDDRIAIVLGDFSSTASMAASPVYQRAGLPQLGFTNSHPDFTKTGSFIWSNSASQAEDAPELARYAVKDLALKRLAVFYQNTDWGHSSDVLFEKTAKSLGAQIVTSEGFLMDERDFRSTLTRARPAQPDGLIFLSYYQDGALLSRQARVMGLNQPIVAIGSVYSPKFIELGGAAVNGVYTQSQFFPSDLRPEVQSFVKAYKAKYGTEPDNFSAVAYDSAVLIGTLMEQYGSDRRSIEDGLGKIKNVPSLLYGRLSFNPQTRRAEGAQHIRLVVRSGSFTPWDGKPAGTAKQ